jgi:hypothetical protein
MKKSTAILVWGVLIFAIGTYLDQVRVMILMGDDPVTTYILRFGVGLALAVLVVLLGRGLRRWLGGKGLGPGDWFMAGALAWLAWGAYGLWQGPGQLMEFLLHDTLFIAARWHVAAGVFLLYVLTASVYFLGRVMNRVMGFIHFFVTHAAMYVLLWMRYFNPAYQVKGYLDYHEFQDYNMVSWAYVSMAILLLAAQLLFLVNLILLFFRKGRRRGVNGRFQ